jgi:hypothetical protein
MPSLLRFGGVAFFARAAFAAFLCLPRARAAAKVKFKFKHQNSNIDPSTSTGPDLALGSVR